MHVLQDANGREYYWNIVTNKTTFEKPDALKVTKEVLCTIL